MVEAPVLKIRPKGTAVEAMRYDGTDESKRRLHLWMTDSAMEGNFGYLGRDRLEMSAGDFLIRTSDGKFFRCGSITFHSTYDIEEGSDG